MVYTAVIDLNDLSTPVARVQVAWWLRDRGAYIDMMSPEERAAFDAALAGYSCNADALRAIVARYNLGGPVARYNLGDPA